MKKLTKSTSTKIQLPGKPYGIYGDTIMWLPIEPNATGTKQGDIIAELDDGYLTVWDKSQMTTAIYFIPKGMVQL